MTQFSPGDTIGPYTVVGLLGKGGMGTVYLAEDPSLGRRVAIKILHTQFIEDAEIVERFRREARALARLRHPNLMHIYSVGEHEGRPYFAMEHIHGTVLSTLLAQSGPLPPAQAARITADILAALHQVHKAGIIHRDVKAGNIILDEAGRAILMDFGLARGEGDPALTAAHRILGTPTYMSPEQARTEELDARTDLYSLGVVLYEMLTGSPPFTGKTSFEILRQHIESSVPPPSAVRPDAPLAFDLLVARAVAKSPADRFQSAREMAAALADACPGMTPPPLHEFESDTALTRITTPPPGFASTVRLAAPVIVSPRRAGRLPRWLKLALGILALLLLAALIWLAVRPGPNAVPTAGSQIEIIRRGAEPVRGRLIEIENLDDGTTTAKIVESGTGRTLTISIREGDELRVHRDR